MKSKRSTPKKSKEISKQTVAATLADLSDLELTRLNGWLSRRLGHKSAPTRGGSSRSVRHWIPDETKLLGTIPDEELAKLLRRSKPSVCRKRIEEGISAHGYTPSRKWNKSEIAQILRRSVDSIQLARARHVRGSTLWPCRSRSSGSQLRSHDRHSLYEHSPIAPRSLVTSSSTL